MSIKADATGIDTIRFEEELVLDRLLKLDSRKSPGPDGLYPHFLKMCAHNIAKPCIFQESFDTGQLPMDWRQANVCPIFKKGSRSSAGDYRPVSLTSVVCKLMEGIIKEVLTDFTDKNKLITNCQHGFLRGRSCLTNLLESFEQWTAAVDDGYGLDVTYLDYRKAFDVDPHQRLLFKLGEYGIPEQYCNWIRGFLSTRRMRVGVNGSYSLWTGITSGHNVPQEPRTSVVPVIR